MTDPHADPMTHLPPETLAGYLDDDLLDADRRQAELHIATCVECRRELGEVRRLQRGHSRRRWGRRLARTAAAAAAAAVVLVVTLPRHAPRPSETRGRTGAEPQLGIVSPAPSEEVGPGTITFTWRSAGPGATYSFTLQEADGRVAWSTAVADTVTILPDSVPLARGRTWFWYVEALLPNGRSLSTGVQRLRTRR